MALLRQILLVYFVAINLFSFGLCGWDKRAAKRGARRVPERRLLAFCALGGSPAFLLGMALFHHKTRKARFFVFPLDIKAALHLIIGVEAIR